MAHNKPLDDLLRGTAQGRMNWNRWRMRNPKVRPNLDSIDFSQVDLRGADLSKADLRGANFHLANLVRADLQGADLRKANLSWADLSEANLSRANLRGAQLLGAQLTMSNLSKACLAGADLTGARLPNANLSGANLRKASLWAAHLPNALLNDADLSGANLIAASLVQIEGKKAKLTGCYVYGISVWDVNLAETDQSDLIITRPDEPAITVDNLEVALFVYLLLRNEKVRDVIDTITSKVVLILGRFSEERKAVLDAIREQLRSRNYSPILFDFTKPASKDLTGTVETLARMARFIIADLTDPSSIPHELATLVPFLRTTPVLPIRLKGSGGYSMFDDFRRAYPWVLKPYEYSNMESLISSLAKVIAPADKMAEQFRNRL